MTKKIDLMIDGEVWYTARQLAEMEEVSVQTVYIRARKGMYEQFDNQGVTVFRKKEVYDEV
jgi:hypothetical protein